jgi:hypothetical protein
MCTNGYVQNEKRCGSFSSISLQFPTNLGKPGATTGHPRFFERPVGRVIALLLDWQLPVRGNTAG